MGDKLIVGDNIPIKDNPIKESFNFTPLLKGVLKDIESIETIENKEVIKGIKKKLNICIKAVPFTVSNVKITHYQTMFDFRFEVILEGLRISDIKNKEVEEIKTEILNICKSKEGIDCQPDTEFLLENLIENAKNYIDKHIDLYYLFNYSSNSSNSSKSTLLDFKNFVEKKIKKMIDTKSLGVYKNFPIIRKPCKHKDKKVSYYYYFISIWCKVEKKCYFIRLGCEIPSMPIIDKKVMDYCKKYPDRIKKLGLESVLQDIEKDMNKELNS